MSTRTFGCLIDVCPKTDTPLPPLGAVVLKYDVRELILRDTIRRLNRT